MSAVDLTAGIATGDDRSRTDVRMTWQWERRAGIWSDVLSPVRAISGRLASLQVSIGIYRQGHIRETVSCERLYSEISPSEISSFSPSGGQGGVIILPCEEHLSGWLGASQRRLVWELGQTCEAAGDGTMIIIHSDFEILQICVIIRI